MSCRAGLTKTESHCSSQDGCFLCRESEHQEAATLMAGLAYPRCSIVVAQEADGKVDYSLPLKPLELPDETPVGVVINDLDLALEAEDREALIAVRNAIVDPDFVVWPQGFTDQDKKAIILSANCCLKFRQRVSCDAVPEEYLDQLENTGVIDV